LLFITVKTVPPPAFSFAVTAVILFLQNQQQNQKNYRRPSARAASDF
jgi:hypothetical protein